MFNYKSLFIFSFFICICVIGGVSAFRVYERAIPVNGSQLAGIFFTQSVEAEDLKDRYEIVTDGTQRDVRIRRRKGLTTDPIKILIVPGHDNINVGASFEGTSELELNRIVGQKLYQFLSRDEGFKVKLAHKNGDFDPEFKKYFAKEAEDISDFRKEFKEKMDKLVLNGKVSRTSSIIHKDAPTEVVKQLYGINKWVNENKYDIVIHIHFNDYPGRKGKAISGFSGFTIYTPERQFSNAKASKDLTEDLFKRLSSMFPVSNHPKEAIGMVEDQELIAIGAYNTLDAISVLIEYAYIYESQLHAPDTREKYVEELAYQTYAGIKTFFGDRDLKKTTLLPYMWQNDLAPGLKGSRDVLALQAFLRLQGYYPPEGKSFNDCPLNGTYLDCSEQAVTKLQIDNGLEPSGSVGPQTRELLHNFDH